MFEKSYPHCLRILVMSWLFKDPVVHFTETHRKTPNFNVSLLNLISTCHFLSHIKDYISFKKKRGRFSLPKFCRSSIYVITIVKFSNKPIQNLFNFPQETSMDFCKVSNHERNHALAVQDPINSDMAQFDHVQSNSKK